MIAGRQGSARVYASAGVVATGEAFQIVLDGRPVRTPRGRMLACPSEPLAQAVAAEWAAQETRVMPQTMPLTRLSNAAIDLVAGDEAHIVEEIAAYAGTDLLCYRAEGPEGLLACQRAAWDPVLEWAATSLGARLTVTQGVLPVAQPPAALARVAEAVATYDAFALTALHTLASLTGSCLLALAQAHGRVAADEAWAAAHVDEDWQIAQWGEDAEAMARRRLRRAEFDAAFRLLDLLRS